MSCWEDQGKLKPIRTSGGHRRYDLGELLGTKNDSSLTHKDRLLRFGSDLIFYLCQQFGTEVIIINRSEDSTFEEDLTKDVLEIITVFSAGLYGSRSHKNKQIIQQLREVGAALE